MSLKTHLPKLSPITELSERSRTPPGAAEWVLIVDDDVTTGRALGRWVKHVTGLDVRIARTTHQAQCWVANLPEPLAILSDFELQNGETGALALQKLRSQGCQAPAAVMTGVPELAMVCLAEADLPEVIPVFCRTELHVRVSDWLEQLRLCWLPPKKFSA